MLKPAEIGVIDLNNNDTVETAAPKIRYRFLDELRGFAVFCMIFYHGFYTAMEFDIPFSEDLLNFFMPAEPFFAAFFILLSGAMCQLSHSNLIRGAKLAAVAAAVTVVTLIGARIGIDGCEIYFGVLHLLACGMLLTALINPLLKKLPIIPTAAVFLLLFALTCTLEMGTLSIGGATVAKIPDALYESNSLFFLGFHNDSFYSADYFPLLPWIFLFLCGASLGLFAPRGKFPHFFKKSYLPFLGFLGRHALLIYIVHQPLFFGFWYIIDLCF